MGANNPKNKRENFTDGQMARMEERIIKDLEFPLLVDIINVQENIFMIHIQFTTALTNCFSSTLVKLHSN